MLTREEKEEMRRDGLSVRRREEFSQAKKIGPHDSYSLDEFIRFLMDIQKIFFPVEILRKKTITRLNKL